MVVHHPSSDLLMSYGAGALGECWSIALATHLALCPVCRSGVEAVEALRDLLWHGGSLVGGSPAPAALGAAWTVGDGAE